MASKRVVVAMSGGVDSSVALALLKEKGYDCVGVSMQLWDYSERADQRGAGAGSCCSLDDLYDARRVAEGLGVPFYVLNLEHEFKKNVVDYFISGYLNAETPNPCVKCNEALKFKALLDKAVGLEAGFLATGHYARIEETPGGLRLLKAVDRTKDQSYFLFTLTQRELEKTLFPLGDITKKEVREIAKRFGLKTSDKRESQEICFVDNEKGYAGFIAANTGTTPKAGEISDSKGNVLGLHRGLTYYTIGQRKGLGLGNGPFYVLDMDLKENRLIVGGLEGLYSHGLIARDVSWITPEHGATADNAIKGVEAKIRYSHHGATADVLPMHGNKVRVMFSEPQKAISPGQAVVFYSGEAVLGGGWIEKAI